MSLGHMLCDLKRWVVLCQDQFVLTDNRRSAGELGSILDFPVQLR